MSRVTAEQVSLVKQGRIQEVNPENPWTTVECKDIQTYQEALDTAKKVWNELTNNQYLGKSPNLEEVQHWALYLSCSGALDEQFYLDNMNKLAALLEINQTQVTVVGLPTVGLAIQL